MKKRDTRTGPQRPWEPPPRPRTRQPAPWQARAAANRPPACFRRGRRHA